MELQRTGTQINNSERVFGQDRIHLEPNLLKQPSNFPINSSTDAKKRRFIKKANPWGTYQKFFILDQAGPAILAHHNARNFEIVAIKESKMPTGVQNIFTFTSDYVVSILDIFCSDDKIFMVYEYMEVSLRHIGSISSLDAYEIASVSKEVRDLSSTMAQLTCIQVIAGLKYIHRELQTICGQLDCGNILIGAGKIKIGRQLVQYFDRC